MTAYNALLVGGAPQATLTTAGMFYEFGTGTGSTAWTTNNQNGVTTTGTTIAAPKAGIYTVSWSISYELAAADKITIEVFKNGAQAGGASAVSSGGSASEPIVNSGTISLTLAAGDLISLDASCSASSVTPTWIASMLSFYGVN